MTTRMSTVAIKEAHAQGPLFFFPQSFVTDGNLEMQILETAPPLWKSWDRRDPLLQS